QNRRPAARTLPPPTGGSLRAKPIYCTASLLNSGSLAAFFKCTDLNWEKQLQKFFSGVSTLV
ncbi:MAG: hypothetical protein ACRYFV_10120, partial [Janthinobacterium lividum]